MSLPVIELGNGEMVRSLPSETPSITPIKKIDCSLKRRHATLLTICIWQNETIWIWWNKTICVWQNEKENHCPTIFYSVEKQNSKKANNTSYTQGFS